MSLFMQGFHLDAMKAPGISMPCMPLNQGIAPEWDLNYLCSPLVQCMEVPSPQPVEPKFRACLKKLSTENSSHCTNLYETYPELPIPELDPACTFESLAWHSSLKEAIGCGTNILL